MKVAEEADLNVPVFAVGKEGEIIFQKDRLIMQRSPDGVVTPFRGSGKVEQGEPSLQQVIAYAWAPDGTLYLSEGNRLRRVESDGIVRQVVQIDGKLLEPKIWNSTGAARIWSIAVDPRKRVYIALPDIGQVMRIDPNGTGHVIDQYTGGWRVTGVATQGDSVFLLESSDKSNVGPRVRVIRGNAKSELFGQVEIGSQG
jgi:sugar lactone lactonase YvrE